MIPRVIHAQFLPSETKEGGMKVMRTYIEKTRHFQNPLCRQNRVLGGLKRSNFSQMQRACEKLGIEIIVANSPKGKGCIERSFDTFQNRLVPQF